MCEALHVKFSALGKYKLSDQHFINIPFERLQLVWSYTRLMTFELIVAQF